MVGVDSPTSHNLKLSPAIEVRMKRREYPSKEFFRGIYDYSDGCLFHHKNHNKRNLAGKRAGRIQRAVYKEYRQVKTGGVYYYEHIVIWIMHNGPVDDDLVIDHINGCGLDNRIENLRVVSVLENNRNKRRSNRGSASGFTGVTFDKQAKKWKAHIEVLGKHKSLGHYDDPETAYEARRRADIEYGFDVSHGASKI